MHRCDRRLRRALIDGILPEGESRGFRLMDTEKDGRCFVFRDGAFNKRASIVETKIECLVRVVSPAFGAAFHSVIRRFATALRTSRYESLCSDAEAATRLLSGLNATCGV